MEMMKKLLSNLGRTWNKLPKSAELIQISKGLGTHGLVTITTTELILHSTTYYASMPVKQTVVLDGYTLAELVDQLNSMGYSASLLPAVDAKGLRNCKATVLLETTNIPIIQPYKFSCFTSELWQLLYPLARLLQENAYDTDNAIHQMTVGSSAGAWADYFASFFNVQRLPSEDDSALHKRIFMEFANIKTNNTAIQHMLQYVLNSPISVDDVEPALFSVTIDIDYVSISDYINQLVSELRGAGIDYFLNYSKTFVEDYSAYFKDKTGVSFRSSAIVSREAQSVNSEEFMKLYRAGMRLCGEGVAGEKYGIIMGCSMTLATTNGTVVRSEIIE